MSPPATRRLVFLTSGKRPRGSEITRAIQPAALLGAALDPPALGREDVAIMVKTWNAEAVRVCARVFCDVNDSIGQFKRLAGHPGVEVLALTELAAGHLRARLPNAVRVLPIQHCNFEGARRPPRPVETVLVSGDRFQLDLEELRARLEAEGLRLLHLPGAAPRQELCAALLHSDLALGFSSEPADARHPLELKPPLKLLNAGAFGIPYVAFPEPALRGHEGAFLPVRSLEAMVAACRRLRDDEAAYRRLAEGASAAAEHAALERVLDRYRELLT